MLLYCTLRQDMWAAPGLGRMLTVVVRGDGVAAAARLAARLEDSHVGQASAGHRNLVADAHDDLVALAHTEGWALRRWMEREV